MTTPTPDALAKLRELEAKATPGPWQVRGHDGRCNASVDAPGEVEEGFTHKTVCTTWDRGRKQNRYFIAAARNALPALLAVAEAARALQRNYDGHSDAATTADLEDECQRLESALRTALAQLAAGGNQ